MRFRFSIGGMMALVAYCAALFGAAAFLSGVDPVMMTLAGGLMSLELALLCSALLGVAYCRGARRGFWAGFAVFGWALALFGIVAFRGELGALAVFGVLPFSYIGGLVGRGFAERAAKADHAGG
ncbi:hypothetical protein [Tautonia plasticadhaerens]|uniref:Uncharacterized protein n=1 Tax=Tautonia plasticadhaerens TaxID=2527974 RepID=A0A518HBP1_9BACT|nr:hypothetical protein [Tautonia plasticadhaerens]QDV38247.1 hypothetical protein ElP_61980 [Tautonia plasticadhaerens]